MNIIPVVVVESNAIWVYGNTRVEQSPAVTNKQVSHVPGWLIQMAINLLDSGLVGDETHQRLRGIKFLRNQGATDLQTAKRAMDFAKTLTEDERRDWRQAA